MTYSIASAGVWRVLVIGLALCLRSSSFARRRDASGGGEFTVCLTVSISRPLAQGNSLR